MLRRRIPARRDGPVPEPLADAEVQSSVPEVVRPPKPVRRQPEPQVPAVVNPFIINGMDMTMAVANHPRRPGGPVTIQSLLAERVESIAGMLDGSLNAMMAAAKKAKQDGDIGTEMQIQNKLAEHARGLLTSPIMASLRPEQALVDLDQFSPETQGLLAAAFEAAERELKAKEMAS